MWNRKKRKIRFGAALAWGSCQEEIEEIGFVPSAVSEPLWALHLCDNQCREQGFKFHQIAGIVTEEAGAVHTIKLCKYCYNERRATRRTASEGSTVKLWKVFGMEQYLCGIWEHSTVKKSMGQGSPGRCGEREAGRHTR